VQEPEQERVQELAQGQLFQQPVEAVAFR